MSIKDDILKLTKPTSDPTTLPIGLATALIKMMTQISFDPLKGSITVPGADEFLQQTAKGFVSLSSPPVIKSLDGNFDAEPFMFQMFATVNVSNIKTEYLFEISKIYSFSTVNFSSTGTINDINDVNITTISNSLDPGTAYFYRLTLVNKNGTTVSNIKSFGTIVRKKSDIIISSGTGV